MISRILDADIRKFLNLPNSSPKPTPKDLATQALEALKTLSERRERYRAVNQQVAELSPNFTPSVQFCDSRLETEIVNLLDVILGGEIASYFLYEVDLMKDGGAVYENDVKWPIKTYDDVVRYVRREKQKA